MFEMSSCTGVSEASQLNQCDINWTRRLHIKWLTLSLSFNEITIKDHKIKQSFDSTSKQAYEGHFKVHCFVQQRATVCSFNTNRAVASQASESIIASQQQHKEIKTLNILKHKNIFFFTLILFFTTF